MTTPANCPECGAAVRGVDIRQAPAGPAQEVQVPDASSYVLLPCGHPAEGAAEDK